MTIANDTIRISLEAANIWNKAGAFLFGSDIASGGAL
jgi:hypothetical protein